MSLVSRKDRWVPAVTHSRASLTHTEDMEVREVLAAAQFSAGTKAEPHQQPDPCPSSSKRHARS